VTIPPPSATRLRPDGWTPERRRLFLETVSAGHSVEAACAHVGLSRASAYALRNRDDGFSLGWSAASLRARDAIADSLTSRILDGQVETWTLPDGSLGSRRRYDNRLALAMLTRLDRLAEHQNYTTRIEQPAAEAARGVAHDFGSYLDLIEHDEADPVTVARFVDARIRQLCQLSSYKRFREIEQEDDAEASIYTRDDMDEAVRKLLDDDEGDERYEDEDDEHDGDGDESLVEPLDAAGQAPAGSSDDDGRVAVELPEDPGQEPSGGCSAEAGAEAEVAGKTWFDRSYEEWRTNRPPAAEFRGLQHGSFGEEHYWRTLSASESEAVGAPIPNYEAPLPVRRLTASDRRRFGLSLG
jgi:hypothetical protein